MKKKSKTSIISELFGQLKNDQKANIIGKMNSETAYVSSDLTLGNNLGYKNGQTTISWLFWKVNNVDFNSKRSNYEGSDRYKAKRVIIDHPFYKDEEHTFYLRNEWGDNAAEYASIRDLLKSFDIECSEDDYTVLISSAKTGKSNEILGESNKSEHQIVEQEENKEEPNNKLNIILYGPPGTGKTYHTINKALDIIEPNWRKNVGVTENDEKREKTLEKFNDYVKEGRIVFTTFHQALGYEDFIEGIKPDLDNSSDLLYRIESGIFKKLCDKAYNNYLDSQKDSLTINKENAIEKIVNDFLNDAEKNAKPFNKRQNQASFSVIDGEIVDKNIERQPRTDKIIDDLVALLSKKISWDPEDCRPKHLKIELGNSQENSYTSVLLPIICKEKSKELSETNNSTNNDEKHNELQNYVLIIDEINRGNVANIFGELITLIEEDKRLGNKEAMTVTLPCSKEKFGVPNNLYIIGTMNTADRSVEALDSALRRRFVFEEMMPDASLLNENVDGVNLKNFLETINKRIEVLKDREHQIGHSYLINVTTKEQLVEVIYKNIIPLLQEYFYGDYEKIQMVLGEGFVKRETSPVQFAVDGSNNYNDDSELYSIAPRPDSNNIEQALEKIKFGYKTEEQTTHKQVEE